VGEGDAGAEAVASRIRRRRRKTEGKRLVGAWIWRGRFWAQAPVQQKRNQERERRGLVGVWRRWSCLLGSAQVPVYKKRRAGLSSLVGGATRARGRHKNGTPERESPRRCVVSILGLVHVGVEHQHSLTPRRGKTPCFDARTGGDCRWMDGWIDRHIVIYYRYTHTHTHIYTYTYIGVPSRSTAVRRRYIYLYTYIHIHIANIVYIYIYIYRRNSRPGPMQENNILSPHNLESG